MHITRRVQMKILLPEIFLLAFLCILPCPAFAQSQLTVERVMAACHSIFRSSRRKIRNPHRLALEISKARKLQHLGRQKPLAFAARQLTSYNDDDGAENSTPILVSLRMAKHFSMSAAEAKIIPEEVLPIQAVTRSVSNQSIWQIAFRGGSPRK